MPIFDTGYGSLVTAAVVVDTDDSVLMSVDGGIRRVALSAVRGCQFRPATTGSAYTATRDIQTEDFLLTVNANTVVTLAGGGLSNEMSVWNIVFVQNATGGWTIDVTGVAWVGGNPTFTTTALASNHCSFYQHGTGTVYGVFGGSATS